MSKNFLIILNLIFNMKFYFKLFKTFLINNNYKINKFNLNNNYKINKFNLNNK